MRSAAADGGAGNPRRGEAKASPLTKREVGSGLFGNGSDRISKAMRLGIGIAALFSLVCAAPATAGQAVTFRDGRTLAVEAVALEGTSLTLTLPGGSEMSLPVSRITAIEELPDPVREPDPREEARADPDRGEAAWRRAAGSYATLIEEASDRYGLDPALLTAMAGVESSMNPRAVSPKGAAGLLQLMPDTARRFGVDDVFDVSQNVEAAARYMNWLLHRYDGRTDLALAGYNAGEGAVDRYRGVPPYRETRNYVARVLERADRLGDEATELVTKR